ncbi:MAG: AAA family ATPase [Candidatus Aenigmatarchaeota archaeon]
MKYFIVIRGPLGIGKTTIAKKLAKKLGAYYVSIDKTLKKHNLDMTTFKKDECIPLKNFIKATNKELPKIKKILKSRPVVIEHNFYHKKQIIHLIRKLDTPHFIFTLKAPVELCVKRDAERKKSYGKDATYQVYKLVTKFNYGRTIDIKNKTVNMIIKEIILYVK